MRLEKYQNFYDVKWPQNKFIGRRPSCKSGLRRWTPCRSNGSFFAMQFLAMKYLLEHKNELENKLYVLPEELNTEIAALKLQAMGVGIDKLTQEQETYLHQA